MPIDPAAVLAQCQRSRVLAGLLFDERHDLGSDPEKAAGDGLTDRPMGHRMEALWEEVANVVQELAVAAQDWQIEAAPLRGLLKRLIEQPTYTPDGWNLHAAFDADPRVAEAVGDLEAEAMIRGRAAYLKAKAGSGTEKGLPVTTGEATHSADFSHVDWFGDTFEFSPTQAKVVGLLWAEWEKKPGSGLRQASIAGHLAVDVESYRIQNTFRNGKGQRHRAWKSMVGKVGGRGVYGLLEKPAT